MASAMAMMEGNCILLFLVAAVATLLVQRWQGKCKQLQRQVAKLEAALKDSVELRAAERTGRIRAQQKLRQSLLEKSSIHDISTRSYPMVPIGFIQSCFSTRNGTPRQPLIVPLARACLLLPPDGVPATALDGLMEYSHCWILYIFHANTDLPHLWKQPNHQEFKAKVRVPRLDGGKLGVYATRSPHRPCPIGLTVAKVEGVCGRMLLISGADLVDGTPVLDVKPYLPYCDYVVDARAPSWVTADAVDDPLAVVSVEFSLEFVDSLSECWEVMGKESMYSSPQEFQKLIEQVLSRDIRSLRQRKRPQNNLPSGRALESQEGIIKNVKGEPQSVIYKLILEGVIINYTVNDGCVMVHAVKLDDTNAGVLKHCNYSIWRRVVAK